MPKLAILIPSYKRPQVLRKTLKGILNTVDVEGSFDVSVLVGLNKVTEDVKKVVAEQMSAYVAKKVGIAFIDDKENVGKAEMLNRLFAQAASPTWPMVEEGDYVITLDNDMFLKKPWDKLIATAVTLDFELMGFASTQFWCHLPAREKCSFVRFGDYKLYRCPGGIAGGMLLFPYWFLRQNKWTNEGGVYGRDDANMCLRAKGSKKMVLSWDVDWLDHDPLMNTTPDLKEYEAKKKALFKKNRYVFPEGWDE